MAIVDATGPLEELAADVLLCFHYEDEPAPRGRLGWVDWILGSPVQRLWARGRFSGARGAAALIPSGGKLGAEKVLILGLGQKGGLRMTALYEMSYRAAEAVADLRADRILVDLPLRAFPDLPPARVRKAFLEGFAAELARRLGPAQPTIAVLPPNAP